MIDMEQQIYPNRWLRWICLGLVLVQLLAIVCTETGKPWLPLGYGLQLGLLLATGLVLGPLSQRRLDLRIGPEGLALRYFPYQWRYRELGWSEIRHLRLLPPDEPLPRARFGRPASDFTHLYLLTDPRSAVFNIMLVNGMQLYFSSKYPKELLDYVQNGLLMKGQNQLKAHS